MFYKIVNKQIGNTSNQIPADCCDKNITLEMLNVQETLGIKALDEDEDAA